MKIRDTNTNGNQLFLNDDGSRTTINNRPKPSRGKPKPVKKKS